MLARQLELTVVVCVIFFQLILLSQLFISLLDCFLRFKGVLVIIFKGVLLEILKIVGIVDNLDIVFIKFVDVFLLAYSFMGPDDKIRSHSLHERVIAVLIDNIVDENVKVFYNDSFFNKD